MKLRRSLFARPEIRPRTAMHQGATPFFARPVTTGDPEAFVHGVRPSSVSNLSAHLPRDAMRSRTSPLPLNADEPGRYGAEHGAGGHCVGAALASHGRGHRFETCHARQHERFPTFAEAPVCQHAAAGNQLRCDRVGDGHTPACHAPRSRLGWLDQPCQRRRWHRRRYAYSHRISVPSGLTM